MAGPVPECATIQALAGYLGPLSFRVDGTSCMMLLLISYIGNYIFNDITRPTFSASLFLFDDDRPVKMLLAFATGVPLCSRWSRWRGRGCRNLFRDHARRRCHGLGNRQRRRNRNCGRNCCHCRWSLHILLGRQIRLHQGLIFWADVQAVAPVRGDWLHGPGRVVNDCRHAAIRAGLGLSGQPRGLKP